MQLSVTTSFKGKRMIQTNETQLVLGGATVLNDSLLRIAVAKKLFDE